MISSDHSESVDTLVIGGGQAGLSTSYWLGRAGVEHLVLDARNELGGSWPDRWDSFHLVAPNYTLRLPGMHYSGSAPEAFMARDDVVRYVKAYATFTRAPVRLGCKIERLSIANGVFEAHTNRSQFLARNVVLATGPYQAPKVPAVSRKLPAGVRQLHSSEYRRPSDLPEGGVLVVGTGQSGAQIAEELHRAKRNVHISVSTCPSLPRRYRGKDVIWWLMQSFLHGAEVGVPFPTVRDLPNPAARFGCNPHVSGVDGGHDISLRALARAGVRLYGRLEDARGATIYFSDDILERLDAADRGFANELQPLFDAYIAAAGIDAPVDDRPPSDDFAPPTITEIELDELDIRSIVWATGYRLDFSWVDVHVFDEWGYPKHERGVTACPGLYAVGLPWLYSEPSSVFAGVGADAEHVVKHILEHRSTRR